MKFLPFDRVRLSDGTDAMVAPVQNPLSQRLKVMHVHRDPIRAQRGHREYRSVNPDAVTFLGAAKDAGLTCNYWWSQEVGPDGADVEYEHHLPTGETEKGTMHVQPGAHLKMFCGKPAQNHNSNHTHFRCADHADHTLGELPMPGVPVCDECPREAIHYGKCVNHKVAL